MQATIAPPLRGTEFYSVASSDFYQEINNSSSTIISLQYKPKQLVSFKVYEAKGGAIVRLGANDVAIRCQIRSTTYTFTNEHIDQMSLRELSELLNHLGMNANQLN
ncbi:MAG: hypothetical protein ICV85_09870 [Tolypothrix sp. T3-bin4]|nr:hypothetical protein [Tolypothrix sp. T3-bin4]